MGLLESIRKWIDGETGEDLLEAADEHAKPRRVWEEFLVKIAREVEAAIADARRVNIERLQKPADPVGPNETGNLRQRGEHSPLELDEEVPFAS